MMSNPNLDQILETMMHGFAFGRSRTHPYLVIKSGNVYVLRDGPRRPSEDVRQSEIFATQKWMEEAVALSKTMKQERHRVCIAHDGRERNDSIEQLLKSNRFRYAAGEDLFFASTSNKRSKKSDWNVLRVSDERLELAVAKASRRRPGDFTKLKSEDRPDRQFVVMLGEDAIGWVKSIRTSDEFAWVANLQVVAEHRRRGIARALMQALLKDDANRGVRFSILAASKVGSTLYPTVGYTQAGLLQVFIPPKTH